jgi:hypothetical protein
MILGTTQCREPLRPAILAANGQGVIVMRHGTEPSHVVTVSRPGGPTVPLPKPEGLDINIVDVNGAGLIVGHIAPPGSRGGGSPAVWDANLNLTDLRTWLDPGPSSSWGLRDVNERGLAIGFESGAEDMQILVWDHPSRTVRRVPPAIGGYLPYPQAVNDAGVIVGESTRLPLGSSEGPSEGVRWIPDGRSWRRESLGTFHPIAINNRGDMAGVVRPSVSHARAAVWLAGAREPTLLSMEGLEAFDPSSDALWVTLEIGDISEDGMVVSSVKIQRHDIDTVNATVRWPSARSAPQIWAPTPEFPQFHIIDVTPDGDAYGNAGTAGAARWRADGRTEAVPNPPPTAR